MEGEGAAQEGVLGMWGTVVVRPGREGTQEKGVWRAIVDSDTVRVMVGEDVGSALGAPPVLYVLVFRCFIKNGGSPGPEEYEGEDDPYGQAALDLLESGLLEDHKPDAVRVPPWVADPGAPLGAPRPPAGFTFSAAGGLKVWLEDGTEIEGDGFAGDEPSMRLTKNLGVETNPSAELRKRKGLVLKGAESSAALAREIMEVDVKGRRQLLREISEIENFDADGTSYRKPYERLTTMQKAKVWWIPIAMVFYALASNIFEFYQIYSANYLFDTVANDVVDISGVWKSSVVVDVVAAAQCPAGYEPLGNFNSWDPFSVQADRQLVVGWNGASYACMCGQCSSPQLDPRLDYGTCTWYWTDGSSTHYSDTGMCSTNATKAGCTEINSISPVLLTKLPVGTIQATDAGGLPSTTSTMSDPALTLCTLRAGPAYEDLTVVPTGGSCESGTVKCGGICFPTSAHGGDCPVSDFEYDAVSGSLTVTQSSATDDEFVLPIINVMLAPGLPCVGRFGHDGTDEVPTQVAINNRGAGHKSAGACRRDLDSKEDTRYEEAGLIGQWTLYSANGIGPAGGGSWDYNYYPWGAAVDTTVYNSKTTESTEWKLLRRNAIYWKPDCEKTRADLQATVPQVIETRYYQTVLVYFHGFFGLFVIGFVFPVIVVIQLMEADQDLPCCPGKGLEEVRNINLFKIALNVFANIVKIIVMTVVLGALETVKTDFYALRDAGCTADAVTQGTLEEIGPMMDEIEAKNSSAVTTMSISIVLAIIMLINDARTGFRVPEDIMLGGDADGDGIPDFLQIKIEGSTAAASSQGMTTSFV